MVVPKVILHWYYLTLLFDYPLLVGVSLFCSGLVIRKLSIAFCRCVSIEAKNESEVVLKQNISGDSDRTSTDASFSGRVSVSVADDGETALVVSMVGVNSESKDDLLEGSLGSETAQEAFYCNSHPSCSIDDLSHEDVANACIPRNKDISCSSHNKSSETNLTRMVSSEPTQRSSELSAMRESACILFSAEHGNISNEQSEVPQDGLSYSLLCRNKEAESTGEDAALPRNSNGNSPVIKSAQLSSAGMLGNLLIPAQ